MRKNISTSISALALSIAGAPLALAESQVALEEIIVTAQRKEETLQRAALAVDVVSEKEMLRAGVDSSTTLNNVSPSLYVTRGAGANASYFIRGVGNTTNNGYTDPAIAFNIDGVYQGRPQSQTAAFLDLERVEVLKGPQGTLYGRNATAGAINLLPAKPILGETSGYLRGGAGNYNSHEFTGAINAPIGQDFAVRLAATYIENDGYKDDSSDAQEDTAFRAQIAGDLTEKVNARLSLDYSTNQGAGNNANFDGNYVFSPGIQPGGDNVENYRYISAPSSVSDPHTGFYSDAARNYYSSLVATPAFVFPAPMLSPGIDNEFWGATGEINIDLDFGDFVVIPAYRGSDTDEVFGGLGFQAGMVEQETEQYSLETRFSTSIGMTDWILGAYYFNESVSGINAFNQQSIQAFQDIQESDTESTALFARTTWNIANDLRLVGGIRYTDDQKTFVANSDLYIEVCTTSPPAGLGCFGGPAVPASGNVQELRQAIPSSDLPFGFPTTPGIPVPYGGYGNLLAFLPAVYDEEQGTDKFTYRMAVEYDVTESSLLYASYETGYRSGGFSVAVGRSTFEPEYLDAFTIGSKNRFFDNRLQVNGEVFYWEYDDQQVNHAGVDLSGNTGVFTENIGQSEIKGVEVDFQFAATDTTLLKGSVQYLDNEVKEFTYNAPRSTPLPPLTGCPFTPGVESLPSGNFNVWVIDCSGREGVHSPEISYNLGIEHIVDLEGLELIANVDTRYRGDRVLSIEYLPVQDANSSFTADVSVTIVPDEGSWYVTTYIRNFTDEEIVSSAGLLPTVSNLINRDYLPPRTYGVQVGYEF